MSIHQRLNIKLLIPCFVGSLAIAGLGTAYADETIILDTLTDMDSIDIVPQSSSVESKPAIKTPKENKQASESLIQQDKKTVTGARLKLELKDSMENVNKILADQKSTTTLKWLEDDDYGNNDQPENNEQKKTKSKSNTQNNKLPKTFYGIGYEVRKRLRIRKRGSMHRGNRSRHAKSR